MKTRALFIGRFQPLHKGHVLAIKWMLERHDEVVVVLGSSQEHGTMKNPLSSDERISMFQKQFPKKILSRLALVPVPDINDDSRWVGHVLSFVPHCDVIYTNNDFVQKLFRHDGKIEAAGTPLFDRGENEGTRIRDMLAKGDHGWKNHVTEEVADYLVRIGMEERIRKMKK